MPSLPHGCTKPAFDFNHAVDLMSKHRAEHFDPELLDVFLASLGDIKRIHEQYADRISSGLPRQV